MSDYQTSAFGQLFIPLFVSAVTAFVYYAKAAGSNVWQRILFTLHSVALCLAAIYAVLIAPWSSGQWEFLIWPFYLLLVCFLLGFVYTLAKYNGPRELHFYQLAQVPSAAMIWFVGTMTITHDWI